MKLLFRHLNLFYLILSLSWNLFAKIHMKYKKGSVGHQQLQLEMDVNVPRIQRRHNPALCGDMIAPNFLWVLYGCFLWTGSVAAKTSSPYGYMVYMAGCNVAVSVIEPMKMIMAKPLVKDYFKRYFQYLNRNTVQPKM